MDKQEIINRLIFHEGLKLKPYICSRGYKTIGVGRCLDTNPLTAEERNAVGDYEKGITKNAALFLLRNDLNKIISELDKKIMWWLDLDSERKYALLDMGFQLGVNGLLQFKNMLSALKTKDYLTAYEECLKSNYAKQTPKRAKRIAHLIRTGRWEI